jgi:hypothetical protein
LKREKKEQEIQKYKLHWIEDRKAHLEGLQY